MKHLTFIQQMHEELNNNGFDAQKWEIRSLATVKSTNTRADDMLGLYEKVIILSKAQSQGRGRQDKVWYSPDGGMWLSVGFLTEVEATELSSPVIETIHEVLSPHVDCEIKEPNDILIDGDKVCGILVETKIKENTLRRVIIGIGINVSNKIPEEISHVATRLKDHDYEPEIHDLATDVGIAVINRLKAIIPGT